MAFVEERKKWVGKRDVADAPDYPGGTQSLESADDPQYPGWTQNQRSTEDPGRTQPRWSGKGSETSSKGTANTRASVAARKSSVGRQAHRGQRGQDKPGDEHMHRGRGSQGQLADRHTHRGRGSQGQPADRHTHRGRGSQGQPADRHTHRGRSGQGELAAEHTHRGQSGQGQPADEHTHRGQSSQGQPADGHTHRGQRGQAGLAVDQDVTRGEGQQSLSEDNSSREEETEREPDTVTDTDVDTSVVKVESSSPSSDEGCGGQTYGYHVIKTEPIPVDDDVISSDVIKTEPISRDVIKTEPISYDVIKIEPIPADDDVSSDVIKTEPISRDVIKTEPIPADDDVISDVIKTEPIPADDDVSSDVINSEPMEADVSGLVIKMEAVEADSHSDVVTRGEEVTANSSIPGFLTSQCKGNIQKTRPTRERVPHMSAEDYRLLLAVLSGQRKFGQDPREKILRRKIYRYKLKCAFLQDPYRGETIHRLTRNGRILLPVDEIQPCIKFFRMLFSGDGAIKLLKQISEHYYGISKNHVVAFLNAFPEHAKSKPSLKIKASLQPAVARQVMDRHEVDLVSFENSAVVHSGQRYSFVLSILDCFSRFVWLRALTNKQSRTIAEKLEEVYLEFGPPKTIQTDGQTEFQGAVSDLASRLNIQLVRGKPHSKFESEHEALFHSLSSEKNWVAMLPYVARNYNTAVHRPVLKTPYEIMFSVRSNTMREPCSHGKYADIDEGNREGNSSDQDEKLETVSVETLTQARQTCSEGKNGTRSENTTATKQSLAKHPSTEYQPGDIVLVKTDAVCKKEQLACAHSKAHFAVVQDRKDFWYTLTLLSGPAGRKVKVQVDKMTSLTKARDKGGRQHRDADKLLKLMVAQTSPETGADALERNAALQGLKLDRNNVGGGDCLFLAISQQLEKVFGIVLSHGDIREAVVGFMREHPTLGSVHLPSFVGGYSSWHAYLEAMSREGTWGDHLTLTAAASMYHMSIAIVSSVEGSEPIVIDPESGTPMGIILLGHIAELHYVTLRPA